MRVPSRAAVDTHVPTSPAHEARFHSNRPRGTHVEPTESAGRSWLWLILLLPYIALLWLPFYNDTRPSFAGFPFFYWYQFLWVPLTSLIIYIVYRGVKRAIL